MNLNKIVLTLTLVIFASFALAKGNRWQGVPFPSFELADQNNMTRTNENFNDKWVVYYFYPKDKTPGCTTEAKNFVEDYAQYKQLNTEIVGISYDDTESHKDFADTYEIKFTLLADVNHTLTKALDVDSLFPWPHPSRETFLVDPKGNIVKHYDDVDPDTHSTSVLKHLKILQKELTTL